MATFESMLLRGQLVMLERNFAEYLTIWRAGCWTGAAWQAGVITDNPAEAILRDGDTLIDADLRPGRNLAIGEQATGQRYIVHGDGVSGRGPVAVLIKRGNNVHSN